MLEPIYRLLFGIDKATNKKKFLALTQDQIKISYKTYKSDDSADMQAILDQKLTPGILLKPSIQ